MKMTAAEGLREAVNNHMGLAVSSEWNFSPELRSGKVVEILEDWALPLTNLSAVYPAGRLASTRARAFVSFVERYMGGAMSSVSPAHGATSAESVEQAAEGDTQRGSRAASRDGAVVASDPERFVSGYAQSL
jgi:hypothetical protein